MKVLWILAAALILGGCATVSPDGGFGTVSAIVKTHGAGDAQWTRTDAERKEVEAAVRERLSRPLSIDDAVRIALVNNRALQATYAEAGIGETELVEASWPRNPGFTLSHIEGGGRRHGQRRSGTALRRHLEGAGALQVARPLSHRPSHDEQQYGSAGRRGSHDGDRRGRLGAGQEIPIDPRQNDAAPADVAWLGFV